MSHGRSSLEPKRWSEDNSDAPAVLRAAIQEARSVNVEAARISRLAERLGVGQAASNLATVTAVSSSIPASGAVAYKLWAYLSGAVAVSGVALVLWTQGVQGAAPAAASRELEEPGAPIAVAADRGVTVETGAAAVGIASEPVVPAVAVPAIEASSAVPAVRSRRAVRVVPATVQAPPAKLDAEAELAILNGAQHALRQAPRRALTLAEQHAESYPRGVFAQEREVIAIEALLRLQHSDAATERGRQFLADFPTSTHVPRVQQLLGHSP